MAIIYSYQENEELRNSDRLVGTATTIHNGKVRKVTKNFSLGDLKAFISTGDLILSNGGTSGPATLINNVLNIPVYQGQITLTTTGSSGAATLIGNTLNIPNYTTSTPTLNQVLTAGNTSIIDANIGTLGIWDVVEGAYAKISSTDNLFVIKDPLTNTLLSIEQGSLYLNKTNSINAKVSVLNLTSNRTYYFPDATGTIALTSDLTGYVTSVGATGQITSTGGTTPVISTLMHTNRLIGRTTAGTGVMEEIAVGSGLTLSAGTLSASGGGTVTSVGLSMPSAFNVANSPITSTGTLAVTGAGTVSQYVRGDGTLANFPNSTGGGASVNYYLNGSISQGTFGGDTYYQMSKTPILGAGTNFIRTNGAGNGYIASFLTDAGDPSFLNIPGGNWNLELYFQSSASGGSPQFYGEIYKVSATNVFTLVASGSANPEGITNGTTVDQYFTSIPVPQTSLLITDRLAIRIYVITGGRTITLHTENGNLCEVLTTFTTGLTALNGLTSQVQYFAVGTSGTDFNISSATDTHTFNLPTASATNRGALSTTDWSAFNGKFNLPSLTSGSVLFSNGTTIAQDNANFFWDDTNNRLGIGTATPTKALTIRANTNDDGILLQGATNGPLFQVTRDGASNNTAEMFMYSGGAIRLAIRSSANNSYFNGGNFVFGATTAGARLDVRAQGALSTDIAFRVRNSADSADLLVTNGLGNVGIGTASPQVDLDVASKDAAGTVARIRLTNKDLSVIDEQDLSEIQFYNSDADGAHISAYIKNIAAETFGRKGQLAFGVSTTNSTNAVEALRIDENANIGIGTTSPTSRLTVLNTSSTTAALFGGGVASPAWVSMGTVNSGAAPFIQGISNSLASTTNLILSPSGGNVGIGTTSPTAKLDVTGNINVSATATATTLVATASAAIGLTTNNNGARILINGSNVSRNFQVANNWNVGGAFEITPSTTVGGSTFTTPALVINGTNSNVGIGTTAPTARLHVAAPGALSTDIALRVRNSADTLDLVTVDGTGLLSTPSITLGTPSLDNNIRFGGNNTRIFNSTSDNSLNFQSVFSSSTVFRFRTNSDLPNANTSGTNTFMSLPIGFAPTSGTGTWTQLSLTPTINQTGGANGITRGLYINPTLTAAADFRAIENSVGKVCLNTTSGNTMIGTSTDAGYKLDVNGTARFSGIVRYNNTSSNYLNIDGSNTGSNNCVISNRFNQIQIATNTGAGAPHIALLPATGGAVGINTSSPNASAITQIDSTTQGFLPPRMTNAQRLAIATPAVGLCVYCTDVVEGLYINKSTGWTYIG